MATKLTSLLPGAACWKSASHITSMAAPAGMLAKKKVRATGTMPGSPTLSRYTVTFVSALLDMLLTWAAMRKP